MFQQETNPSNVDVVQNTTDNFFAHKSEPNSDEEQLDDRPFLSHRIADDQESFSEKFLRNILTYEYQNQMPRRREKFVEIVKTVTVTEIVNGGPDKHPSSCEVKVTNLSPSGPHPVNVSITHLNERWRSSESLESEKGTVIRIQETHQPYHSNNINNSGMKKRSSSSSYKEQESVRTKVEKSSSFNRATDYTPLFNKSSDNIIDLEFTHPHLIETSSTSKGTRAFADLRRKCVSKTTKTETTEHEKVTTTSSNRKRSCSAQPQVRTLYYRKFIDTHNNELSDDESSQGSMIDNENRSRSAEPIPIPPPRKRLGKEESLHYYREDEEVQGGGVTSVSINDNYDHRNITAGITTVSVNDSCTDTSFESRFSTIPRTSSHHIHFNVIGPERSSEIHIDRQENRRRSSSEAPPKPPRRAKYDNATLGEPLATSTPMATIERKISRRPPDINIIECENDVKSPSRTPIVVVNQTPTSRRSSQDLLSTPAERRRKSTVTDIDWYAAFNMKEPDRRDIPIRRRASESSLAIPPADIDLNQVFICTKIRRSDDEKCQCNACRLIRLSDNERRSRSTTRQTTSTSSRIFNRTFSEFTTNTVPSRHSTPPVEIMLDDIFNPKPKRASTKDKKINLDDIFNNETYQSIDQSKVRTSTKTNKSHADQFREDNQQIQIPPQDGEIRTTTTMKITTTTANESKDSETKKGTYIVTRKQRAQDIDAFDFDENTRKIEVTIPIIPTEKSKPKESVEVSLDLNNQYKSKQENPTIEVTDDNGSIYSETTLNLDNIFNVNSTNQISETVGKNLEEHISDNTKSETVSTSSVTLTESRKYLDEKVEDEETINRPPSSPAEPIIDKTSENLTSNALSEVNILLNNELDKKTRKTSTISAANVDLNDVFDVSFNYNSNEDDIDEKLRRRTDEFSKNKSDKKLPEVNETRTTTKSVQLLDDSNISIDDVFNISSTIPKQDEDQKEVTKPIVPIISDVLLETEENIHRPPSTPTESVINVDQNSTSLTEVKIELEKQATFEDLEDDSSEKPESLNLDNIFNISFTHKNDDVSDSKLQQRISEFNKNKSEKKLEQEEKDSKIEYSSNLDDSNISLEDVFNLKKYRKLSRNIEEIQYSPRKEEIETLSDENNEISELVGKITSSTKNSTPEDLHDQISNNLDTEDKSALNLDDILNVRFNQNTSESVDEKLKQRISEFEKNKSDKKHQEGPIKYTTTSNINLDDSSILIDEVFNFSQAKPSLDDHQHEEVKIPINIPDSEKSTSIEADSESTTISKMSNVSIDDVSSSKPNEIENNPIVSQFAGTTMRNILDQIYEVGTIKDIENATHQIDNENISRKPSNEEKKEPNSVGEISQPNEPTTSANLDEIFNVSFKHDEDDVNDEKLKKRIAEFEKNKSDKKHQEEPIKYTTTSNVNLDDSNISIDDVFNVSQTKPSLDNHQIQEVKIPHNVPDSEKSTSIEADSGKKQSQQTLNLNLDEVLNVSFKHGNEDVDDGKLKQRIAEFEKNTSDKKNQQEPTNYTTTSTVDFNDSNIPIDDVFSVSQRIESVDEDIKSASSEISINREVNTPIKSHDSEQSTSTEIVSNTQTFEQTSNLNLDDVFNVNFKHNEEDVNDEKLKRRIAEFENNKSHKQPQETTIISTEKPKVDFDNSEISLDDVFNEASGEKIVDQQIPSTTSGLNIYLNQKTSANIEATNNVESNVIPKSNETSALNMREVFDVRFTDDGKDVDDEKIRQRIAEFKKNTTDTKHEVGYPTTTTKSSNLEPDDSKISIDDMFNFKPNIDSTNISIDLNQQQSVNIEATKNETISDQIKTSICDSVMADAENQPSGTTDNYHIRMKDRETSEPVIEHSKIFEKEPSSVNLDDVFNISFTQNEEDVNDLKLKKRIEEFEKNKNEKQHQVEEHPKITKSSINLDDSNISMDDVFNIDRNEQKSIYSTDVSTTRSDEPSTDSTLREKVPEDQAPIKIPSIEETPHVNVELEEKKSAEVEVTANEPTRKSEILVIPENSQPTTSTNTVNLEEIFNVSFKHDEDVNDEKLKKRIAEFEKNKSDKKHQEEPIKYTTTSNVSLDDSSISIDDVFNISQRKPSLDNHQNQEVETPINVPESEKSTSIEIDSEKKPSQQTSNLNLDEVLNVSFKHENEDVDDGKLKQRIAEFENNKSHKKHQEEQYNYTITSTVDLDDSQISIDNVFNVSPQMDSVDVNIKPSSSEISTEHNVKTPINISDSEQSTSTEVLSNTKTSEQTSNLNLDDVFNVNFKHNEEDVNDEKLKKRISEFERNKSDKKHQEEPISYKTTATVDLNDSRISIDDVFNVSKTSVPSNDRQTIATRMHIPDCEPTTSTEVLSDEKTSQSTAQLNLDDVFNVSFDRAEKDVNDEKLKQRISEFEMNKSHKKPQDTSSVETKQPKANLDDSAVSLDEVFNTSISKDHEEKTKSVESEMRQEDKIHNFNLIGKRKSFAFSDISELYDSGIKRDLDDFYNISQREDNEKPKTEFETNITTSSIFLNDSRPSFNRVVKEENEETTETIDDSETTTSTTRRRQIDIPKSDQKNKNLQVVTEDKFNTSSTSTISLDDSFTRQRLPEIDVNTLDSIFLSPPMSNPRSRLVQENSVSSPTRISQEIKYEWIADILSPTSTVVSSAYIDLEDNKQVETNPTLSSVDQIPSTSSFGTTQNISESFSRSKNEPLSPRRYSNFYEERKSISVHPDQEEVDEMYDEYNDFYIRSVKNQEVDIDVSHFVDDILGKSLDEAAFLSSTKSLDFKKHTDTSIDRKKKKEEKMTQEEKGQQQKQQDDLINLIFNQSSQSETIVEKQIEETKNDEEMLEIESNQDYFIVKGSYSLVIPKTDPLGQLLSKLSEEHELATLDFSMTRKLKAMLFECIKERATNEHRNEHPTMSIRGQHLLSSVDNASKTFLKMNDNKYHYKKNPKGIINFCTAENNLCTPLLEERFKHLELFIPNTEHLVRYPPSGGWPETRQILCKYFQQFMNAQVEPNELVLTASTRTGYDVISHCLFEPHDILLTNGPIYTGTISNPNERAQCIVECVPTDLTKKPKLDLAEFQKYYDKLTKEKDQVVGGIIIVNPHNPLGVVFPPEEVIELCNWASKLNLKVIIDEVFANCVYDKDSRFKSYLSYRHRISRPENVTYLWSVSKEFGLPGLKFAVIHTNDESLKLASTKLQYYYPCSALVQDFAVKLLSDFDWLKGFHAEVQRRIRIHYTYTSENLKNLQIPFVVAQAGIFVFADFSAQLKENSEKAELELWNRIAEEVGVMLTPGVHQKCVNFGWFRLVFACTSEELEEGFRRLYKFMKIRTKPLGAIDYLL